MPGGAGVIFRNDLVINSLFKNSYEYDSQKRLNYFVTDVQRLPTDAKNSMKHLLSGMHIPFLNPKNDTSNHQLSEEGQNEIDNMYIHVDNFITKINYNAKGQISHVEMPANIGMQVDTLQIRQSSKIDVIYDNSGKISSITAVTRDSSNANRGIIRVSKSNTTLNYTSDTTFKALSTYTDFDGKVITNNTNYIFNTAGNLLKITSPSSETTYADYYSDYNSPSTNRNLEFISGLRGGSPYCGLSKNCTKKMIQKNLKTNEIQTTTISAVNTEKCCVVSYTAITTAPNSWDTVTMNLVCGKNFSRMSKASSSCSLLPPCPCYYDSVKDGLTTFPDGEWKKTARIQRNITLPRYHPGSSYEARWVPKKPGTGQQCTYDDSNTKNLITEGLAAGSLDKFSPIEIGDCNHYLADVWTWGNINSTAFDNIFVRCPKGNLSDVVSCLQYSIGWPTDNGLNCRANSVTPIIQMLPLISKLNCEEVATIIRRVSECPHLDLQDYILGRPNSLVDPQIKVRFTNWKWALSQTSPSDDFLKILDKAISCFP